MPDVHRLFRLAYTAGTMEIAPYQPWPEELTAEQASNPAPSLPAQGILPQHNQGTRGKSSLGRECMSSDENDSAVEKTHAFNGAYANDRTSTAPGLGAGAAELTHEWVGSPPSLPR